MISNIFYLFYNYLDYYLRQLFHWKRRGLIIHNETKEHLFSNITSLSHQVTENNALRLLQNYHLCTLYNQSTIDNYKENLYYLDMLEHALEISNLNLDEVISVADIGTSHWFYVQSLYALLKWYQTPHNPRKVFLTGYEEDAFRVYKDFYSRYDYVMAHIGGLRDVKFVPEKFKCQPDHFDVITILFPFVFIKDHLAWGLPHSYFSPQILLRDAFRSLKQNGVLIIANQGENECISEVNFLEILGIKPINVFRHMSNYYNYDIDRFIIVATRN